MYACRPHPRPRRGGSRRRRNGVWGSTTADYEQRGGNPRRRARFPGLRIGGRTGFMLGTLDELIIRRPEGGLTKASRSMLKGWYVACFPESRGKDDIICVRKVSARIQPGRLSPLAVKRFRQFHKSEPRAAVYDWPDRRGHAREVGLVQSLTYIVPPSIRSPEKNGYRWVHAFGDHGESAHGPVDGPAKKYPTRLMPALLVDSAGNLTIKRRPGNRYNVTEWIYW